jgi:hypothetical protein
LKSCGELLGLVGAGAIDDVNDVAEVLFVGDAVGGFGGEFGFGFEMGGKFGEKLDAVHRVELIAAHQGLDGKSGFRGCDMLAKAGGEVGVFAEGIEFAREQLVEVRLGEAWVANDDGIRGDVPQALTGRAQQHGDTADKIERWQHVHKAEQVARDDLVELESETFDVHDAQAENPFADGLAAKTPFTEDSVTNADNEVGHSVEGSGKVRAQKGEKKRKLAENGNDGKDAEDVDKPGEKASDRTSEQLRETDAFGGADLEGGGSHER